MKCSHSDVKLAKPGFSGEKCFSALKDVFKCSLHVSRRSNQCYQSFCMLSRTGNYDISPTAASAVGLWSYCCTAFIK